MAEGFNNNVTVVDVWQRLTKRSHLVSNDNITDDQNEKAETDEVHWLENNTGVMMVLSEGSLIEMKLAHRLRCGEEIGMVIRSNEAERRYMIYEATPRETDFSVLRLRTDGKAEVIFMMDQVKKPEGLET